MAFRRFERTEMASSFVELTELPIRRAPCTYPDKKDRNMINGM